MESLKFETAFKYPFNRAKGMWNILWIFVPIVGWFALGGYSVRIVKEFVGGKFDKLPSFSFSNDLSLGFMMLIKAVPFMVVYGVFDAVVGKAGDITMTLANILVGVFVIPILSINFFNKETVASFFEFKIVGDVFNNIGDYLMAVLKSILLSLVFLVLSLVLVGIPAGAFTKNIFLADFYRRRVGK
ncbi:MAG: DUF4013 domain-containing protein [Candidatus Moranbacteria bacterium]|jgi:hypothetical protein|nr:DUF4013 domain-containing protein [Candidatus Moranbacteria bacterium]MDD5651783.1 DUF4013 domain-containing protein [Candidatus Moranbacteria bacterium]MDX9855806.1 DUF4013 domain-containing protein [Candidatus Moranbacteria bacterium]